MADKRKPWFKFYSRDWRSNAKLRLCGLAARGLWADLLSLMHESAHRGFLLVEGVIPNTGQLANLLGAPEREIKRALKELSATKVYSVTGEELPDDVAALVPADMPKGVLISRRMVRDEEKARKDKANGTSGGNPQLKGSEEQGVNPEANPQRPEAIGKALTGLSPDEDVSTSPPVAARANEPGGLVTPHEDNPKITNLLKRMPA